MEKEQAKIKITELTEKLKKVSYDYYQQGSSGLSDKEYDELERELKELEEKFPELLTTNSPTQKINDDIDTNFSSIKHTTAMLSLKNIYTAKELEKWQESLIKKCNEKKIYCDLKIDGMAISLIYKKGTLQQAITRGNGEFGDDITKNIQKIISLPKKCRLQRRF